jgi:hypothetical protein
VPTRTAFRSGEVVTRYNKLVFILLVLIHRFSSANTAVQLSREFLIETPGEGCTQSHALIALPTLF